MSFEPRSRIVTEIDGKLKLLFSVREQKRTGDLRLLLNGGPFQNSTMGSSMAELKEKRISIHTPPRAEGQVLIKRTTKYGGIVEQDYYRTTAPLNNKADLVYAKICQILNDDHFDYKYSARDKILNYGIIEQKYTTILYCIMVGSPEFQPANELPFTILRFSKFSIIVYAALCPVPSPPADQDLTPFNEHPLSGDKNI